MPMASSYRTLESSLADTVPAALETTDHSLYAKHCESRPNNPYVLSREGEVDMAFDDSRFWIPNSFEG